MWRWLNKKPIKELKTLRPVNRPEKRPRTAAGLAGRCFLRTK